MLNDIMNDFCSTFTILTIILQKLHHTHKAWISSYIATCHYFHVGDTVGSHVINEQHLRQFSDDNDSGDIMNDFCSTFTIYYFTEITSYS